jgi:hypothetical protein
MTNYEIYVFVLCMVVFVLLTATFSYLITIYAKQELELIRNNLFQLNQLLEADGN